MVDNLTTSSQGAAEAYRMITHCAACEVPLPLPRAHTHTHTLHGEVEYSFTFSPSFNIPRSTFIIIHPSILPSFPPSIHPKWSKNRAKNNPKSVEIDGFLAWNSASNFVLIPEPVFNIFL